MAVTNWRFLNSPDVMVLIIHPRTKYSSEKYQCSRQPERQCQALAGYRKKQDRGNKWGKKGNRAHSLSWSVLQCEVPKVERAAQRPESHEHQPQPLRQSRLSRAGSKTKCAPIASTPATKL